MANQQKPSKILNFLLWAAQIILAASLGWASMMKLFQPVEKLAAMWPWVSQVPNALLKFTGVVDLLGAAGLILPALFRIKPWLTPITAVSIILLMIIASIFHIARGEASVITANIVFAAIAAFIAWGRFKAAPILI